MGIEPSKLHNEPLAAAWKDIVPAEAAIRRERLGATIQARIELESTLRVCGVEPQDKTGGISYTSAHRKVLVRMLLEADSPLSASLRAAAAATAGPLKLTEAAPVLRLMSIDEKEDRRTRLHAIESYISLVGAKAARDLGVILRSRDPLARSTALVAALRTNAAPLTKIAEIHLQTERDAGVKALVNRRVSSLNQETATAPSSVAPTIPAEGRQEKKRKK